MLAYGGIDVLVSNAGVAHSAPVAAMALEDWERSFAVNARGHFLVAREAMRLLIAQGLGGALVFIATKNVMAPGKDFAAYSAAKAAQAQLGKVLALEGAPHGIRANIVNHAVFRTQALVRGYDASGVAQGIAVSDPRIPKRNPLGVRILPRTWRAALFWPDRSAKTTGYAHRRRRRPRGSFRDGARAVAPIPASREQFGFVWRVGLTDSVWCGDHLSFHMPPTSPHAARRLRDHG